MRIVESRKKKIKLAEEKLSDRMKNLNLKNTTQKWSLGWIENSNNYSVTTKILLN